jgi:hypothetical protein
MLIRTRPDLAFAECEAELRSTLPTYDPALTLPRVIVWHNAVARMPFPPDLFCGPYDTHFGIVPDEQGGFNQQITFRGSELPEHVKL